MTLSFTTELLMLLDSLLPVKESIVEEILDKMKVDGVGVYDTEGGRWCGFPE